MQVVAQATTRNTGLVRFFHRKAVHGLTTNCASGDADVLTTYHGLGYPKQGVWIIRIHPLPGQKQEQGAHRCS